MFIAAVQRAHMLYVAIIGGLFLTWFVLVLLFTPALNYRLRVRVPVSSPDFLHLLESTCQAATHAGNRAEVFTDGPSFYPAMIEAIRGARTSVNLECYIFNAGEVGDEFVRALADRARAGVIVTIVADAIGSSGMSTAEINTLTDAGCRVEWYQPVTWYRLARLNNRTHREILVVDGCIAFVGGAGIADWWMTASGPDAPPWRDMMVRLEGPVVAALQGVFVENWLECCGEILSGPEYFPDVPHDGPTTAIVVRSSPSDRATVSRVAFQVLIEGAEHEVRIATPYFLPDRTLRAALAETSKRGVEITVIVPGPRTDQRWVRIASRRMYGELLAAGVRILEYERAMTHVKTLLVDDLWAIVGTTNVDNRSFEHNDEVNVALLDPAINRRLLQDFERDVASSREVTLDTWKRRPLWERMIGPVVWILERQQ
jgi:cardiolipin synthase